MTLDQEDKRYDAIFMLGEISAHPRAEGVPTTWHPKRKSDQRLSRKTLKEQPSCQALCSWTWNRINPFGFSQRTRLDRNGDVKRRGLGDFVDIRNLCASEDTIEEMMTAFRTREQICKSYTSEKRFTQAIERTHNLMRKRHMTQLQVGKGHGKTFLQRRYANSQ